MGDIETMKIKHGDGYAIINKHEFDPKQHKEYKDAEEEKGLDRTGGARAGGLGNTKNPSGTYSEPTPTDIRFPDKTKTEFENNLGAHIGKSAAEMREHDGKPDMPGGLDPQVDVPEDWEDKTLAEKRELVNKLGGEGDSMKMSQANKFIEGKLADRADAE